MFGLRSQTDRQTDGQTDKHCCSMSTNNRCSNGELVDSNTYHFGKTLVRWAWPKSNTTSQSDSKDATNNSNPTKSTEKGEWTEGFLGIVRCWFNNNFYEFHFIGFLTFFLVLVRFVYHKTENRGRVSQLVTDWVAPLYFIKSLRK